MGKPTDWSRLALFKAKRIDGRYVPCWGVYEIRSWHEALREACGILDTWVHPCRLEYVSFGYYERTIWNRKGERIGSAIYPLVRRRHIPGLKSHG